ncbi:hypothetical protein [Pseudoalteromonas luteoviolacea]|uniref:Uncharacterized protein n=1 Tax=Pseudoalteromonas luteoviolacea NCIMB 1942 TaxID=1365253 RepID=A0A162A8X4_9GAMM|nr:hypothetical protein [Pseudoalteromonas luteoviolacea]KZN46003.1 hypothetical protein N482_13065 [Pseudoalteromonas luteoviolacea NCIMB 1942]
MGSKSSSDSRQTTNNTNTSLGVNGDNNGYMTVGNGNTYNIQQTDHGLVDGMVSIWGDMAGIQHSMMGVVGDMAYDNAQMTQNVMSDGFAFAGGVSRDAIDAMRDTNRDSLDFAESTQGAAYDLVAQGAGAAFDFGRDALDVGRDGLEIGGNLARDAQQQAFAFGADALFAAQTAQNNAFEHSIASSQSALDFGAGAVDAMSNLAGDSMQYNAALSETAISENSSLAAGIASLTADMQQSNNDFAAGALNTTVQAVSSATGEMSNLARDAMSMNAQLSASAMEAYDRAGDQTLLAHKQALQFADHASRSDGQQLAISTNKTMTYVMLGVGGLALAMVFLGRK